MSSITFQVASDAYPAWRTDQTAILYFDVDTANPSRSVSRTGDTALSGRAEFSSATVTLTVSINAVEISEYDAPQWETLHESTDCGQPITVDISDTGTPFWRAPMQAIVEELSFTRMQEDVSDFDVSMTLKALM